MWPTFRLLRCGHGIRKTNNLQGDHRFHAGATGAGRNATIRRDSIACIAYVESMRYSQADLDMANRHVAEGERHVVMQEELVGRLRLKSQPTAEAEALLALFNATLAQHRLHRDQIEAALKDR